LAYQFAQDRIGYFDIISFCLATIDKGQKEALNRFEIDTSRFGQQLTPGLFVLSRVLHYLQRGEIFRKRVQREANPISTGPNCLHDPQVAL
jgi:hypothetical protein